ncbi:MAG: PhzF family phenazine biosynthesis protein [Solirubrobacterales bacterium]
MAGLHVLRVFCAEDGSGGNPLGVFLEGDEVPESDRQGVAAELGFAETVFVDDRDRAELRIFTPETELPLAGHPLVGTAWLLREEETPVEALRPPAGETPVNFERELTFVAARPEWAPRFEFIEVDSPAEVDALTGPPEGYGLVGVWSWLNRDEGWLRERVFVPEEGIPEDEATGAAALLLCAKLGHPIEIRQGRTAGSLIFARPYAEDREMVEIGGRVALDDVREY